VTMKAVAAEPIIVYPRKPRPSYADHVIWLFRDRGFEPRIVHEAGDLQTALGLVAAGEGICLTPISVERLRREDIVYRPLNEPGVTSPIILSHRIRDRSSELQTMIGVIRTVYAAASLPEPAALDERDE
jgi:LysR family transcriptional regulator, benzoate and cis,cis-muconate-responsive activator of ben and cat genes